MADNHESFKELVAQVKNQEELDRVMQATPIRDQWKTFFIVGLAILILSGTFALRTKRFKSVMNDLENSSVLAKLKSRGNPKANLAQIINTEKLHNQAEEARDVELPSNLEAIKDDGSSEPKKSKQDLSSNQDLERKTASSPPMDQASQEELVGISNKTPEPELDAFNVHVEPNASNYREAKQVPAAYSKEKSEFPDLK